MAYVPPHLRKKAKEDGPAASPATSPNPLPASEQETLYTNAEICQHYGAQYRHKHGGTLQSSALQPDTVQFVVLYHIANPRWESDNIIFVKSNLHLLRFSANSGNEHAGGAEEVVQAAKDSEQENQEQTSVTASIPEDIRTPSHPIAVYHQSSRKTRSFHFLGYFKISKLDYLSPRTDALARMLLQKWESGSSKQHFRGGRPAQREPERWAESLSVPWAVVKFEKVPENQMLKLGLTRPEIEIHAEQNDGGERKGVTEMLKELRMRDLGANKTHTENNAGDHGEGGVCEKVGSEGTKGATKMLGEDQEINNGHTDDAVDNGDKGETR